MKAWSPRACGAALERCSKAAASLASDLPALLGLQLHLLAVAACATLVLPTPARASWPERTVKMIVTFPAGSANDSAARILADALGKKWHRTVIVEDKPGAEGTIGV